MKGLRQAFTPRFLKLWGVYALISILLVFFAGLGYFVLAIALRRTLFTLAGYSDRVWSMLAGRQPDPAHASAWAKFRASKVHLALSIVLLAVYYALAVFAILKANFRLIDAF